MTTFDHIPNPIRRRSLLLAALAAGGASTIGPGTRAWSAPPVSDERASSNAARVPEVLSAEGAAGSIQTPAFAVGHLGVSWTGHDLAGWVRLRYVDGWRGWEPVRATDSADSRLSRSRRGSLRYVGPATAYEFRPARTARTVRVLAINTVDGPPSHAAYAPSVKLTRIQAAAPETPRPFRYLSRAGWGADESLRFGPDGTESFPTRFFDVQTLTVHHTVTANADPDPAATVRAIYFFQAVTEDFGDIGYHLLIDQAGVVYEGRYSGPDRLPVFGPRSVGPRPSMVNAAHVAGFNAGNVGVALLGDLTGTGPTAPARQALVSVLAALAATTRLDPLGTTDYVNPISGATRTVPTLAGHRDWAATECPGNTFYPMLPQLRADVAAALQ